MAGTNHQYRAITTRETSSEDGLNVRAFRDQEGNLNNYFKHAGAHKIVSEICIPAWASADTGTTTETVIMPWAPRLVPDGFNKFYTATGHRRTAGSGADSTTWTLYCSAGLYTDSNSTFDATALETGYQSSTLATTNSDTLAIADTNTLQIVRDADGLVWLCLTATNNDATVRSELLHIDITPGII